MSVSGGNASPSHCCAPAVCQAEAKTLFHRLKGAHLFPFFLSNRNIYIHICICTLCVCGGEGVGHGRKHLLPQFPNILAAKGLNAMTKSCG